MPKERVKRRRVEMEPVAGRMPALGRTQLRAVCECILDAGEHLDYAEHRARHEPRGDEDGGPQPDAAREGQPKRRTLRRTRIALNPSLHVIFFPSA
jgi:hypothetical protein